MVSVILDNLAAEMNAADILEGYPHPPQLMPLRRHSSTPRDWFGCGEFHNLVARPEMQTRAAIALLWLLARAVCAPVDSAKFLTAGISVVPDSYANYPT